MIYALNITNGKLVWNYTTINAVDSAAENAGITYFTGQYYDMGVLALNSSTGKKIWSYSSSDEYPNAPVAVSDGKVYLSYFMYNATDSKFYGGGVCTLNALKGNLIWNYKTPSSTASPTVRNGVCYISSDDSGDQASLQNKGGFLYALNASRGNVIWNYTTGQSLGSTLLVGNHLFLGTSGGVCGFNASSGELIWTFAPVDFSGSSGTHPAYANGVLYVGWDYPLLFSNVTVHNFYAIDSSNGEQLWNYTLGYTVLYPPAVMGDCVFVGATWVSSEYVGELYQGPGAVIALNWTATSAPLSSSLPVPSVPEFLLWVILPSVVGASILVAALRRKKK